MDAESPTTHRAPTGYAYNFRDLKRHASFEAVCAHYNIALVGRGTQRSALCPFHNETKPSLKINLDKKIFHCFGCEAKGNILEFVARIENQTEIVKAAVVLADICHVPAGQETAESSSQPTARPAPSARPNAADQAEPAAPTVINPPLTFTLKLNANHPYLDERRVSLTERQTFGLGYCNRGMMAGRICIPIHNGRGELVAYAGRWPGDEGWPEEDGRYKLPSNFQKSRVLFNLHRIADANHVVLVEGYWSVIRLNTLGVPVASPMGWSVSSEQIALLRDHGTRFVTLLADGDDAGRRARERIVPLLSNTFFVRSPELPDGMKPDTIDEQLLLELVAL
jgi:DNA primase